MERPSRQHQRGLEKVSAALVEVEEGFEEVGLKDWRHGEGY